jgi:phosphopantothenoylcysteine decarboxylase/phosphopantothenate--cysteine ligase
MLIAPCTASTIGKMAHGIADNMLITTYLSMKAPVLIAPAMDLDMYAHVCTQENLRLLQERGVTVVEPGSGFLASTLEGKGRMQEPERIVEELEEFFARREGRLRGQRILITAGPTYEKLDPVRFIGNYSSGKMGIALAKECINHGANVELVLGPCSEPLPHSTLLHVTRTESAADMYGAATGLFPKCTAGIMCAAVADFTPDTCAEEKIKREGEQLLLRLTPTRDIAAALGEMKTDEQKLCGFALETHNALEHAQEKLKRKKLDMIIMNSLQDPGAGFQVDTNKVTVITAGQQESLPLLSKKDVAKEIINKFMP